MNRPVICERCWTQFDLIVIDHYDFVDKAGKTISFDRSRLHKCPICHPDFEAAQQEVLAMIAAQIKQKIEAGTWEPSVFDVMREGSK